MQGECLSPSLFSMYLNDIVEHIESVESMGVLLGNTKITVLKYADDLVLFAKSAESLQLGLNALHQFCKINKLTVNCDKSKVMHFTANKSVTVKDLQYDGTKLEWVNNFKYMYLGVTFNKSNSFTDGIEELCQHAQRAQTMLDLHFLKHKTVPVSYEIEVFNTLIKPILSIWIRSIWYQLCEFIRNVLSKIFKESSLCKTINKYMYGTGRNWTIPFSS